MKSNPTIRNFIVLFPALFTAMCGLSIIVPLLPIYADRMGVSGLWLGLIFSAFSISRFVAMPVAGSLSDRIGRKCIIATGLLLFSLISLGFMYAKEPLALVLLRLGQGFCASMVIPIAQAYAGDVSSLDSEGKIMGVFTFAIFAGMGIGPMMGGWLQDLYGIHAGILSLSILTFVSFLIIFFLLPEAQRSSHVTNKRMGYASLMENKTIKSLLSLRFIISMCRGAIIAFVPIYAHEELYLTSSQIGIVISVNIITVAVMQVPAGIMADKFDRKLLIIGSGSIFCLLLFAIPSVGTYFQLLVLSLLSGFSGALMLPAATAMFVRESRDHGMGAAMSLFNMAMSLGLSCGPLLAGCLTDLWSVTKTFHVFGAIGLSGIFIFGISSNRTQRADQIKA